MPAHAAGSRVSLSEPWSSGLLRKGWILPIVGIFTEMLRWETPARQSLSLFNPLEELTEKFYHMATLSWQSPHTCPLSLWAFGSRPVPAVDRADRPGHTLSVSWLLSWQSWAATHRMEKHILFGMSDTILTNTQRACSFKKYSFSKKNILFLQERVCRYNLGWLWTLSPPAPYLLTFLFSRDLGIGFKRLQIYLFKGSWGIRRYPPYHPPHRVAGTTIPQSHCLPQWSLCRGRSYRSHRSYPSSKQLNLMETVPTTSTRNMALGTEELDSGFYFNVDSHMWLVATILRCAFQGCREECVKSEISLPLASSGITAQRIYITYKCLANGSVYY